MFAVGYEIEFRSLRGRGRAVPLAAAGALLVPLGLGAALVLLLGRQFTAVGERHVDSRSFVLFMAVTVAITALPVLAAIVRERGLAGTTAGVVASAAAGIMDVAAWLVLAVALIGTAHSPGRPLPVTVALVVGFAAAMLLGVRPLLQRWSQRRLLLSGPVVIAFVLAMVSAWVTASLGLHPVFGGFLAGLTMRGRNQPPDADLLRSLDRAAGLLLPLFFVVTGLSLNVSTLHGDALLLLALLVAIAITSKLGPGYGAARLGGLTRHQSATVAALVNTRGLTELIALNVGLSAGVIHQELFTVLVLMALITTLMTGPLLRLIGPPPAALAAEPVSRAPAPSVEAEP